MTTQTSDGSATLIESMNLDENGVSDRATPEPRTSISSFDAVMREEDADLLESMHYEAATISQYSPGGTPQQRPVDRSLPFHGGGQGVINDIPLLHMPTSAQPLQTSETRTTSLGKDEHSNNSRPAHPAGRERVFLLPRTASTGSSTRGSRTALSQLENHDNAVEEIDGQKFRRLLSGEIRAFEDGPPGAQQTEEEETTASPVSVAQEAATTIKADPDSGLAEKRRKSEALQFAAAVGEDISINRDDLCIIEGDGDDDFHDDTDDEALESKEIRLSEDVDLLQTDTIHTQKTCDQMMDVRHDLPTHVDVVQEPSLHRRKSKRPLWPFADDNNFLDHLPAGAEKTNFVYKGICANPPEITKRGIQRGNYAQLHRKAWLECTDKYHRYGKNLRLYYRYWERLGFPTNNFFDWLDSKREAAGQPLPNLEECPRSTLDSDTVLYITNPDVTDGYALDIISMEDGRGKIVDVDGEAVVTGTEGWIFVLRDNIIYGAEKITSITGHSKQRFHHSSFFGGKAVASAGIIITDEEGFLTRLYPHSGHYRPSEAHMQRMLFFLHRNGIDLRTFDVDAQQFRHVSRDKDGKPKKDKEGGEKEKKKKVDSLHLEKAVNLACFLSHKATLIGNGVFERIHKIRKADVTSVSEALALVDDGGFWYGARPHGNNNIQNGDTGMNKTTKLD